MLNEVGFFCVGFLGVGVGGGGIFFFGGGGVEGRGTEGLWQAKIKKTKFMAAGEA